MSIEEEKLINTELGLRVFQHDPGLIDEVTYNGCAAYNFKLHSLSREYFHYYTELITKSTFMITGVPTVDEVRRKIIEVRQRFEGGESCE